MPSLHSFHFICHVGRISVAVYYLLNKDEGKRANGILKAGEILRNEGTIERVHIVMLDLSHSVVDSTVAHHLSRVFVQTHSFVCLFSLKNKMKYEK